jgi:proline dehydrogenase
MGWIERAVVAVLPYVPRPLMRRFASRYIAGEELKDALAQLGQLSSAGFQGILNLLGEDVTSESEARAVLAGYATAVDALSASKLPAYISVKPTQFGLRTDERLALELYTELASVAQRAKLFVRIEMEDHTTTDATLRIFEALRAEFQNVGIVLQARLRRTPDDIARLRPGPLNVRMVKGIYLEPASIAHVDPGPIRAAFVQCSQQLLDRGAELGFATHDDALGDELIARVQKRGELHRHEFQVLMGVREPLWERWRARGLRVRVYVPYGPEWKPYSIRRMRKNPEVLRHVLRQTFAPRRRAISRAPGAAPASR